MSCAEQILKKLTALEKTIAVAESISAGHLQSMLTSVSGASAVFKGGVTTYVKSTKVELLQVGDALAERTNCIDEEVARQMAAGALKLFKSDYAIATCGYAERDDGRPYAFIAVAQAPGTMLYSGRVELSGTRVEAQHETAQIALKQLNELLQ